MEHAVETSRRLRQPLGRVRRALTQDLGLLVAARTTSDPSGLERFESALAVEITSGTEVKQAIVGELGPVTWADGHLVVPVRWRPAGHEHLLPAFAGEFELTEGPAGTRLLLRGAYTVPLGAAGRAGDWAAGRRVARRVLTRHLDWVAERLDAAARDLAEPPEDAHPGPSSENYIG
jgi:hypothetical protein